MASGGMSRLIPNANNNRKGAGGRGEGGWGGSGMGGGATGSFVVTEQRFCHFTESRPAHSTEKPTGVAVGGREEKKKRKKRRERRHKNKNKSAVKVRGSLRQVQ